MSEAAKILVIGEFAGDIVCDTTRSGITAARQIAEPIGGSITLALDAGSQVALDEAAALDGVSAVIVPDEEAATPERLAAFIAAQANEFSHIIAGRSSWSSAVLARVAGLLDVMLISDVVAIDAPDLFKRQIYGGSLLATIRSTDRIKVVTARALNFPGAGNRAGAAAPVHVLPSGKTAVSSRIVSSERSVRSLRDLATARIVVAGGAGMQGKPGFALLDELAARLGGALGSTRAAVDRGYVSKDLQVGQSGKVVAPDLYLAIGISGAIQHIAGMKDAKTVIAINTDVEAPIFKYSDYGLVGDALEIVPEIMSSLGN